MSILKTLNHLYSNSSMEFLRNPSLVLYSSSYRPTPRLSVLSYLIQQQTITYMLMILNWTHHSQLWICLITTLDHVTPLLHDLHWLRIPERITFRLAVLAYHCQHGLASQYLADDLHQVAEVESR